MSVLMHFILILVTRVILESNEEKWSKVEDLKHKSSLWTARVAPRRFNNGALALE